MGTEYKNILSHAEPQASIILNPQILCFQSLFNKPSPWVWGHLLESTVHLSGATPLKLPSEAINCPYVLSYVQGLMIFFVFYIQSYPISQVLPEISRLWVETVSHQRDQMGIVTSEPTSVYQKFTQNKVLFWRGLTSMISTQPECPGPRQAVAVVGTHGVQKKCFQHRTGGEKQFPCGQKRPGPPPGDSTSVFSTIRQLFLCQ